MINLTPAQMRKIHALSRERGLDSDTLHSYIYKMTGKESLKKLSITEAIKIIEGLQDGGEAGSSMATKAQIKYISGLMFEMGWIDDCGKTDWARFRRFIKSKFNVEHENWLTVKDASNVIEAFKEMKKREQNKANGNKENDN